MRARVIFLNLDVSNTLETARDCPSVSFTSKPQPWISCRIKEEWSLFISTQETYTTSIVRNALSQIVWVKTVNTGDCLSAGFALINDPATIVNHLIIVTHSNCMESTMINLNQSPWKKRFQARKLHRLVALLHSDVRYNLPSRSWYKTISKLRNYSTMEQS